MRILSKSKLMALRQCHKRLWLEVHRPELRSDSPGAEARFQAGDQVGAIARRIYDPFGIGALIDIEAEGFSAALTRSSELLRTSQPIFEAGFSAGGALAFADVMLPQPGEHQPTWKMVEVKSSTKVKSYHRDDVAVQTYAAQAAGVQLSAVAVACINNTWVYPGNGDYDGLLKEHDLTEEARSRQEEVKAWITLAQEVIARVEEPEIAIGDHCDDPFECGFYAHCSRNESVTEHPVHWLPRMSGSLKQKLADEGIVDLLNVSDDILNPRQQRVKHHTLTNTVYFDSAGAHQDLAPYPLPAQFLDFETIQFSVPMWAGTRPYQQIPFQYSLHTMNAQGEVRHDEFLRLDGDNPSLFLAQSLIACCGKTAWPIFTYNASFEKSRIQELAELFPEHCEALLAIHERIVDLLPVARERFYHPSQKGSWSIKAVLPAAVPELRYSDLEGVQDGGMAMDAFLEAIHPKTPPDRVEVLRQQLLAYCKLDTYAMVRLWRVFTGNN